MKSDLLHASLPTQHIVYLALGSNLGDRRAFLAAALQRLREVVDIQRTSSIYETDPVGYQEQPLFLNMVCCGATQLTPQALLHFVKSIEADLGRQSTFRNGPRNIDIDILLYDDLRINEQELIIPHPRMTQRAFVLIPLAEISPHVADPNSGHTITELLRHLPLHGVRKLSS